MHTYTYELFLTLSVGLGLVFVHLFKFNILCVFWFSLDCFVLLLFAFVVFDLVSSVLCQEIGLGRTSPKWPLFCVEWDIRP